MKKIGKSRKKYIFNNTCIYDILAIFDQSWKKKERKKIEKYFKSSCLRELKTTLRNISKFKVEEKYEISSEARTLELSAVDNIGTTSQLPGRLLSPLI